MKQTRILMGMPIIVEVADTDVTRDDLDRVFAYFEYVDNKFSPFKDDSEISLINQKKISPKNWSADMMEVLDFCEFFKKETNGYFNIQKDGYCNPCGLVKGWAIFNASLLLKERGLENFYINVGGDCEASGQKADGSPWSIGIRHPQQPDKIAKKLSLGQGGIATSGTYERGNHIYNPFTGKSVTEISSLTVVGPNIFEADVYATSAFAMGREGIVFIEKLEGFEGYMIDTKGLATFTRGFEKYITPNG